MDGLLDWLAHHAGTPPHLFAARRPHYLVVAPPKTGSTWLADNLRCHPGIFIPAEKELKYFSSLGRWLGLEWYLEQFAAGEGQIRGEASPSYACLPPERIRLIRALFPGLKVIFLLREPMGRAWSHTRHCCRLGEAHFAGLPAGLALDDPLIDWEGGATCEWVTASGDYLGQLRRWRAAFPAEQVLVRFYEDIASRPESLFREVLAFLGVDESVPLDGFPLHERINPGMAKPLPPGVASQLHRLWHGRTRELAGWLQADSGLDVPPEWDGVLSPPEDAIASPAFAEGYARRLAGLLELEESFPASERLVCADEQGWKIVLRQRRLLAESREGVLVADTLPQLKEKIGRRRLEQRLEASEARIAALERGLYEAGLSVQHLEKEVVRLRPWYRSLGRWLMDAWRGAPSDAASGAA